jgi:hypothetical protein
MLNLSFIFVVLKVYLSVAHRVGDPDAGAYRGERQAIQAAARHEAALLPVISVKPSYYTCFFL